MMTDSQSVVAENPDWTLLLADARRGDAEALGVLVDSLRNYLWLVTQHQLPQRLQGKFAPSDIVQKTCVDAHLHIGDFTGQSEAEFKGWLSAIAKNNLRDNVRSFVTAERRNIRRETAMDSCNPVLARNSIETPSRIVSRKETDQALLAAVDALPERSRTVILMRHNEQASYAEIGEKLGLSETAARKVWSRSIAELREIMDHYNDASPAQ